MPSAMPASTIASRAWTDWNTELVRTVVLPSCSSNVTVSIETWPGAPSNSNVCTMPSGEGSPWKTPWKPARVAGIVGVDVAPRAAVAQVVAVDRHRVLARPEPLRQQLRLGERAVDERRAARRARGCVRTCGTPGSAVTCISVMTCSFLSDRLVAIGRSPAPAAPRAAPPAARSSVPSTPGIRPATRSPRGAARPAGG